MPNTKIGNRTYTRGPYRPRVNTYDELTTKDCLNYDCPYGYKFQTFNKAQQYCDRCLEDKKNEDKTNMDKWAMLKAEAKDKRKSPKNIDI